MKKLMRIGGRRDSFFINTRKSALFKHKFCRRFCRRGEIALLYQSCILKIAFENGEAYVSNIGFTNAIDVSNSNKENFVILCL
jgi:hypothetical protein